MLAAAIMKTTSVVRRQQRRCFRTATLCTLLAMAIFLVGKQYYDAFFLTHDASFSSSSTWTKRQWVKIAVNAKMKRRSRSNTTNVEIPNEKVPQNHSTPPTKTNDTLSFRSRSNTLTCTNTSNMTEILPVVPSFIIAGAQKAGTTALKELLSLVPEIVPTIKREAHYFDTIFPFSYDELTPGQMCEQYKHYVTIFEKEKITPRTNKSSILAFEKTPRYLTLPHIPRNIRHFFWDELKLPVKIIVILRDPIDRVYSHYKMSWQNSGRQRKRKTYPSFEEVVARDVEFLRKSQFLVAPTYSLNRTDYLQDEFSLSANRSRQPHEYVRELHRGFYAEQLQYWTKEFKPNRDLMVIQYEKFKKDRPGYLNKILDFVGGEPHNIPPERFEEDFSPNNMDQRPYPPLLNHTRAYLKMLYKPLNDQLADLLGEDWRSVWD